MPFDQIEIGGKTYSTGLLPTPEHVKARFARAGVPETIPAYTRDELIALAVPPESIREPIWIGDQDGQGACTGFGSTGTIMECREDDGQPFVELSSGCTYGQINGQRDDGSNIGDSLETLMAHGTVPATVIGQLEWQSRRWPANWQVEAAKFRIVEAFLAPNFLSFLSGIVRGYNGVLGVQADNAFEPGSDGWLPDRNPTTRLNHCVRALARSVVYHPTRKVLGFKMPNSWNGWGYKNKGWCYFPESWFPVGFDECYLIRTTVHPSNE